MSDVYEGRNAAILQATIDGTPYTDPPQSRIEELLLELKAVIEAGGGGGGTTNYNGLTNKPQINDVTLQGNKSLNDLGINIPTVDSALSGTSENPVQNKVIKGALDGKQDKLVFDNVPTENSSNPVKSGGVFSGLAGKQDTLTFDNAPTASSDNPVKSGGIKTALDAKQDTLTFDSAPTASSTNPVTSGGVKTALDAKQDELTFDSAPTTGSNNPVTSAGIKAADDAINAKLYSTIAGRQQNNKGSMELYSVDLNTIVTSGFYNAMTCTNAPFTYCALIVCGYYMDGYCFQLAADINSGEIKTRVQTGGTWGAWSESNNIVHG